MLKSLIIASILGGFMLMATWQPELVLADDINSGVYALDSTVYGKSYEEWTMEFWQPVYGTPAKNNPILDKTGELCGQNQGESPVFFLFFSDGSGAERTCDVPAGKAILVPVNVVLCTFVELNTTKEEDLHECAEEDESSNPVNFLSVDGREILEIDRYRVHSRAFTVNIPEEDPIVGVPGPTTGVSDGYWIILEPLTPGKHEIRFEASLSDRTGILIYHDNLVYHLNVVEGGSISAAGQPADVMGEDASSFWRQASIPAIVGIGAAIAGIIAFIALRRTRRMKQA